MPFYHRLGKIPPKRHTQFRKPDGGLYYEQLFGTIGFDGMYINLYHIHQPTQVKEIGKRYSVAPDISDANNIKCLLLHVFKLPPPEDFLATRGIILTNSPCHIAIAAHKKSMTVDLHKD